jgi:SGNH hydrolase-like domain, acetyltransferase AlgX
MSRIKIAFVVVFFALSALPVLQAVTGFVDISALQEKRRPAPPPNFSAALLHGDGRLSAAMNKWFDDFYGFRALFIRLKNQLDYWVFDHSDKIFIGSDGWLYLPQVFTDEIDVERAGDAAAEQVHQQYFELVQYLAGAGIRLIVIGNPVKESIYPQHLPGNIPTLPSNSRYQKLRSWLKSRKELDFIDGNEVLADCQQRRTFNLIDIHMTFPGGVCFAKALIAQLAKDEGWLDSPWDHSFSYTERSSIYGGEADFMALLFPISQPVFDPDHVFGGDHDPLFSPDSSGVFEWIYRAPPNEGGNLLPPVVMFGDSFLDHYRVAGIQSYLSVAYRARNDDQNFSTVLGNLPAGTRYFVFEFLEPWANVIGQYKIPKRGGSAMQ